MTLTLTALFFFSSLVAAEPRFEDAIASSRKALAPLVEKKGVPGVSVAVAHRGRVVWAEGFGRASLELASPVTPETKFGIGSITKTLTTALAEKLAEEGKLDLDAPLERAIPGFRHAGQGVTARLVAAHLSGMGDAWASSQMHANAAYTTAEAIREIEKEPLRTPPGTETHYATGPFTLVAGAIESATGESFLDAMERRLVGPLGLADTVPNDRARVVPNRAAFYVRDAAGGPIRNAPFFDPSHKWAGAGYLSTASDLVRFGSALLAPGYLKKESLDDLFRPVRTKDGKETEYALAWRVTKDSEGRRVFHVPGGGPGISCWLVLFPDREFAFAILSNMTGAPVGGSEFDAVMEAFLGAP